MTENGAQIIENNLKSGQFSLFDAGFITLSLLAVLVDAFTDVFLVIEYIQLGYTAWAVVTFLLIIFPSYLVQMFSLRWHIADHTCTRFHWMIHILSLGLLHRFFCAMQLGLEARQTKDASDYHKLYAAQSDLSLLHLFESFLESAPQLVIQLYVIDTLQDVRLFTGLSAAASIFSLALSLVTYSRAQRRIRRNTKSNDWAVTLLQASWRLGMLTARICALVILLVAFKAWALFFIGAHWLAMFVWIIYQKTDLCDKKWEERCYNGVAAVIYCFCFFNLKDGRSRWRLLSYYTLIVLQNLTCLTMFLMVYNEKSSRLGFIAFVAILGGTFTGTLSLALYYRFFHPSGPLLVCSERPPTPPASNESKLRSLKRPCSGTSAEAQANPLSDSNTAFSDSKLVLSDSIVIIEESDMEEIHTLQGWIKEASVDDQMKRHGVCSPGIELYENASSVFSTHDYENLAAVNIARAGGIRSWRGYCDIDTWAHDDSVGRDGHTNTMSSTTTTSQDYMDSIADDYADCKTASSLHTIPEESESNCSERSRPSDGACALVATIDQIRITTPVQEDRSSRVRRTFSILRERFENCREPPPPAAPWAAQASVSPPRFVSVKDMRSFFLKQVLTPPKLAALRRKMVMSPVQ